MIRLALFLQLFIVTAFTIEIIQKPIIFNEKRISLTQEYIKSHYGLTVDKITIIPKIIVIHHTAFSTLQKSFDDFNPITLSQSRSYISKSSALNTSAHYMVDKDGTIYQLMPDNIMARHVIGLNYSSIGIENVGGENHKDNLTHAQLEANIKLIKHLKNKYPHIDYVLAHYEYERFSSHPLWLELDKTYRTKKSDPSIRFMKALRQELKKTNLYFKSH